MSTDIILGKKIDGHQFKLPIDLATESCAIIARKGAGKTHAARVLAEDLVEHVPVVIIDPLDVFWGLRVRKDGEKTGQNGCNFVIFGGSHGDLPLIESAGSHFADLIVDRGISAILAVDHLSLGSQRRFVADFAERLFERKSEQQHRTAVHLIIDEADSFAPQKVMPDMARCCGAIDRLVRRGRSRGIGTTCISQRPAVLNKDVLTQTEVLICLQVTAPQDKDALNDWVKSNADKYQASDFMESLSALPRGRAWVWSPSRLQVFEQVNIRDTVTFDSSYTPKVGERRQKAPVLTDVDILTISKQMAAVIEEAEAKDPIVLKNKVIGLQKALDAKVRELDKALGSKSSAPVHDKAAIDELLRKAVVKENETTRKVWIRAMEKQQREVQIAAQHSINEAFRAVIAEASAAEFAPRASEPVHHALKFAKAAVSYAEGSVPVVDAIRKELAIGDKLPKAERLILTALAQCQAYEVHSAKPKIALMAGYAVSGGGFQNALGSLRSKGFIMSEGGNIWSTVAGMDALGKWVRLPDGEELLEHWCAKLGKAERSILQALAAVQDGVMGKDALAEAAGYTASGGGFQNALGKLRTLELISGSAMLRLAEELQ